MFPSVCQEMHARTSAWSGRLNKPVQGLVDNIKRDMNRPVMHDAFPAQYVPLLFHGPLPKAFPAPTKCIRFPSLRGFNLSHCGVVRGLWNAVLRRAECEEERLFLDFEQLQTHHFRQFLVTFKRCRVTNIRVH